MIKLEIEMDKKSKKYNGNYKWDNPNQEELEDVRLILKEFEKDVKKDLKK